MMNAQAYRYRFRSDIALKDAEETLVLSFLAAEGIFGEARVRMNASYAVDATISVIFVDAGTLVGQVSAAIFTAFISREFGHGSFHVCRVEGLPGHRPGVGR